jgi:hypothetical protein
MLAASSQTSSRSPCVKVFISWSGERSRDTAKLLRKWLPQVLNEVEPWVSDEDIGVGGNWSGEIIQELNAAEFGIICVTPGNRSREWLNFEAGAISKSVGDEVNKVAPFLIGFNSKNDLTGPLSRFQAIQPKHDEMLKLLLSLNATLSTPRPVAAVEEALEVWWPKFLEPYRAIEGRTHVNHARRTDSDKIDELLQLVRSLERDFAMRNSSRNVVVADPRQPGPVMVDMDQDLSLVERTLRERKIDFEIQADRLVVATSRDALSPKILNMLTAYSRRSGIDIHFLEPKGRDWSE